MMYLEQTGFLFHTNMSMLLQHLTLRLLLLSLQSVNVVLWGEWSRVHSGVQAYAPGSTGVADRYRDPVGMWPDRQQGASGA
jgi:hypothetical protein